MSLTQSKNDAAITPPPRLGSRVQLRSWLFTWELYLIVLVAGFLRFYRLNATEFDDDQAILFRMARDAVHFGLLPVTSNTASVNTAHPPAAIYLFMIPAAFSASPLGAALLIGFCGTVAAVLTYVFTRRYYGRLAGIVAAFLYATALVPVNYARFIWQPNLMPPFVVLFVFMLFRGVVERRQGWLFRSLVLLGILYQMHETAALLVVPLLLAVALAPETIRRRDFVLAFIFLALIFFPLFLWEVVTKFADIGTFLSLEAGHASVNLAGWNYYRLYLSPYDRLPADPRSVVRMLALFTYWLRIFVPLLAVGGFAIAISALRSGPIGTRFIASHGQGGATRKSTTKWASPKRWWADLRATPYRCGLVLLLVWQIFPLAVILLHSIELTWHYFLILMPGPFILIGLFVSKSVAWLQNYKPRWSMIRYGIYIIIGLAIIAQTVNTTASILDVSRGRFNDRSFQPYPYHNDLNSLQHALNEADQLAQKRHLKRVYVTTDAATQTALRYLAEQVQTPTTLFDVTRCLVLPNPANGPAVLLVGPYDDVTHALLQQFATATLVDSPARLGGPPFQLYVVTSPPLVQNSSSNTFVGNLQFLDARTQSLNKASWLVTRWNMLRSAPAGVRTTYNYAITAFLNSKNGSSKQSLCTFTSMQAGDQLLVAFTLPHGSLVPTSVNLQAQSFTTVPYNPSLAPLHLETDRKQVTPYITLSTMQGRDSITVPVK